jgi:hypothetical protein
MAFRSVKEFVSADLIDLMYKWKVTHSDIHQILNEMEHASVYSKDNEWIIVNDKPLKQHCNSGDIQEYQVIIKQPHKIENKVMKYHEVDNKVMTIYEKDLPSFYAYLSNLKAKGFYFGNVVTHIRWDGDDLVLEFLRLVN